ncbi:hypothetical protein [Salmonella phage SSBI34]|nr:hypothetical protein [Salmonella phage SSBI34]
MKITVTNMKWWALAQVANDHVGGDNKRAPAQVYVWGRGKVV